MNQLENQEINNGKSRFKTKEAEERWRTGASKSGEIERIKSISEKEEKSKEYNKNPSTCMNCHTNLPYEKRKNKFCSKSCAASYNNKLFPKRKKLIKRRYCTVCGEELFSKSGTLCIHHNTIFKDWNTVTISEMQILRSYQINSRIRSLARAKFKGKEKVCKICGYSNHVEVCHIRAISSFPPETKVAEINSVENLVLLCPNHHWEFDNELLNIT
jgi:predicted restriction endonuclease